MSPVIRANWILALLALVLGILLWFDQARKGEAYPRITPLSPATIERITIEAGGQTVAQLEKGPTGWRSIRQQTPVKDLEWIQRLLHIAELPSLQRFPAPRELHSLGLDQPRYRLWLDDTLISWGTIEPLSRRRYVLVDKQIHLITDGYTHHLHAAPAPH
jgi:hypothetical protein